jgi:hypothetical protein
MICARCDQPILPGEKSLPIEKFSPSAAGGTEYVHAVLCKQPPTQTAPVQQDRPIRGY